MASKSPYYGCTFNVVNSKGVVECVTQVYSLHIYRIWKRLRNTRIDSIPPGWEPIPGLLKSFTNSCSTLFFLPISSLRYCTEPKFLNFQDISSTESIPRLSP
jgi:hypothetical protein